MKILKENYKLNKEAYEFISENKELLNEYNFDEFFNRLIHKTDGHDFYSPLCRLIYNKFPNCLSYMTYIPYHFFSSAKTPTSIDIPNNIKKVDDYAFYKCTNLKTIKLPNSVLSIGEGAFANCSKLTSIEIPNSVTRIDELTFDDCSSLTSITIPNSIREIGPWAFRGCSNLKNIVIPNSVTNICSWAFYKCSSLENITIGNGVKGMGSGVFEDSNPLKKVNYLGPKWRWKNIKKYADWNEDPKIKEINCTDGVLEYKR